jgi:signal transduction histidine kinase
MTQDSSFSSEPIPPLLAGVADRILERWEDHAAEWAVGREELTEALTQISRELGRLQSGNEPLPEEDATARPTLVHRLTEAIRADILQEWSERAGAGGRETPSPEDFLELLAAIETYRTRESAGGGQDLAARLSDPDAFELVVELAHDLLSPLNSILFLAEVLRSGHSGPVNEHQRSQLGLMYSATLGVVSVVSDVMELASERRGHVSQSTPFGIGRVFETVEELVRPMAEEKGIELEFRLPNDDRAEGHPNLLGRVLLNLTTNALKFTESGKVTVSAVRLDRSRIEFSVQDTGRGIPPKEQDRVLHPFRKSSGRKGHFFSGSGLGLSIVQRLLVSIGSELRFETEAGVGTRFWFEYRLLSN